MNESPPEMVDLYRHEVTGGGVSGEPDVRWVRVFVPSVDAAEAVLTSVLLETDIQEPRFTAQEARTEARVIINALANSGWWLWWEK